MEQWFVGCNVSHVVTEGTSVQRYLGFSSNLITVSPPTLYFNISLIIEKELLEACNFLKLRLLASPTIFLFFTVLVQLLENINMLLIVIH